MTAHWSKKLDPYWSIEGMIKTNKRIPSQPRRCKQFNTECYVVQKQEMQSKLANSVCYRICRITLNL